jgi:hypothetical protein
VALTVVQIAFASTLAALAAWAVVVASRHALGGAHAGAVTGLVGGSLVGLGVLVLVLWRMRIEDVRQVVALARRSPAPDSAPDERESRAT